jgi:phage terminase large subunit-like protein
VAPRKKIAKLHPAEQYAHDVRDGKIPSCLWVRLCIDRYFDDLKNGKKRGLSFDRAEAERSIKFFDFVKHSKGEWAGSVFRLEPWQQFIQWNLFGWMGKDGNRRFRTAYIEVPRKNGKTTWGAGTAIYLFFGDGEPGSEVYSAATKRDQARLSHSEAIRMVKSSPALRKRIAIFKDNLNIPDTASKYEPLGADADTMDGLNVHGALIDELHEHKKRDTWDVLETATGARRQPLVFAITTAGYDRLSICWEQHEYTEKLLKRKAEDDSYFGVIYTIDEGDSWSDETAWAKANPNLGVSVKLDDLQRKARKVKELPAAQNNFLRKHLCIWTQQSERWIDVALWDSNNLYPIKEVDLVRKPCFGGLDLSSVSDLSAWVMLFPDASSGHFDVLARFWCPESRLVDRRNKYRDQYKAWERAGYLQVTDGEAIDYEFIKAQVLKDASIFQIDSVNVDRLFQGYQLSMQLAQEGMAISGMGMGYMSFAGPMNELETLLLKKQLNHGGNPILRWMADNLAVSTDPAGNRKPNKDESQGKIDGIVATLLALDRAMRKENKRSKYETSEMVDV